MTERAAEARLSIDRYILILDSNRRPELAYDGQPFAEWHAELRARVLGLMGPRPSFPPLNVRTVASESFPEYTQRLIEYETSPGMVVPAYLLVPTGASAANPAPAILVQHGHHGVSNGKEPLVSRDDSPDMYAHLARRYAENGFVVLVPDAIGFGERSHNFRRYGGRDGCNVNFIKLALFGTSLMSLTYWDDTRALDYLSSLPEVDASRIGASGLSFGGTRTMYLSALDDRIRAAIVSGYLTTFRSYALEDGNFCGSQFPPGIYAYGDIADVHGLIAPRPLLIQAGKGDRGFPLESSRIAHAQLTRIYQGAGVPDRLERDEYDGGHEFNPTSALEFMNRHVR